MSTSEFPAAPAVAAPKVGPLRPAEAIRRIPADVWILGGLIVLAATLRFATIASQSYWTDESLTVYEAGLPFGAMLNTVAHVETTPPLYFVLIWGWAKLFGTGEAALRSFSALAGLALIPIAYLSARELVSRRAGMIAAALVAVNPFLIWYSQEARSYILLSLLTGASFLWFIRACRDPSRRQLAWWAACSSLALMTHFFAGFLVAPEALWLLWVARTRIVALAVGSVAFVQLAMLPFALIDTSHGAGWIHAIPLGYRISQVPTEFGLNTIYRRVNTGQGLLGGAILAGSVALLLVFGGDQRTRRGGKVAALIASASLLVPLALALVGPDYFLARNLIPAWVPLVTVIAAAGVVPRARVLGAGLAALLLGIFAVATVRIQGDPGFQRAQWRDVAHALGPAPVARAILAAGGEPANPLKIYLPHVTWVQPHRRPMVIREVDVVGTHAPLVLASDSSPVASGAKSIAPQSVVGVALPRSRSPTGTVAFGRVGVHVWVIERFRLLHPWRVDVDQLMAAAPRFFRHAPHWVLAFVQLPGR